MNTICPKCGKNVPPSALQGLCPECLLKAGAAPQTEAPGGIEPQETVITPPLLLKPEEIARHFPQLEILQCLGRGGMGVVYQARQPRLNRFVALKIVAPEKEKDPQFAERFTREAMALAKLNHPNVVTVYDFGEAGGLYYLTMEYVDGITLRELLRRGKIAPEEALAIVPNICAALQYAHEQGIVHRDIKPENILIDKQGRVKIADFGIAKILGQSGGETPTLTGIKEVIGTPHYMAPEQVEKPRTVDHRADIYSLGVVFYEMLTGELPLGKFAPPSQKVRVDVRLDEVVLHALEKEPERRYQQAGQVRSDVENIAVNPGPNAPGLSSPRTRLASDQTVDWWQRARYRFWPPLVGRRNGRRTINWPAVAMRGIRSLMVIGVFCVIAAVAISSITPIVQPRRAVVFAAIFYGGLVLVSLILTVRILRGFAMPMELVPDLDHLPVPASGDSPKPPSQPPPVSSNPPGLVWFAVIVLSLMVAGNLLVVPTMGPRVLIGAGLITVLLVGLIKRAKWAYLLTWVSCALGVTHTALRGLVLAGGSAGLDTWEHFTVNFLSLILDLLVLVPVLRSTRWFFPPDLPEHQRQNWLWATAIATVVAMMTGSF